MMRVPVKSGRFAMEKEDFMFLSPSSGINNLNPVKNCNHVGRGVLPFTKALGMSAYREAFNWRGMEKYNDACMT